MSQRELSFLMGLSTQAVIAQHESQRRLPEATSLFKYQALFNEPIESLLPGVRYSTEKDIVRRAKILMRELERSNDRLAHRKGMFLRELIQRLTPPGL